MAYHAALSLLLEFFINKTISERLASLKKNTVEISGVFILLLLNKYNQRTYYKDINMFVTVMVMYYSRISVNTSFGY